MDCCQGPLRHDVYRFVVNGCAPGLISGHDLVSIWFTALEVEERHAFGRGRARRGVKPTLKGSLAQAPGEPAETASYKIPKLPA